MSLTDTVARKNVLLALGVSAYMVLLTIVSIQ